MQFFNRVLFFFKYQSQNYVIKISKVLLEFKRLGRKKLEKHCNETYLIFD